MSNITPGGSPNRSPEAFSDLVESTQNALNDFSELSKKVQEHRDKLIQENEELQRICDSVTEGLQAMQKKTTGETPSEGEDK